jgi:hypothetical protein
VTAVAGFLHRGELRQHAVLQLVAGRRRVGDPEARGVGVHPPGKGELGQHGAGQGVVARRRRTLLQPARLVVEHEEEEFLRHRELHGA